MSGSELTGEKRSSSLNVVIGVKLKVVLTANVVTGPITRVDIAEALESYFAKPGAISDCITTCELEGIRDGQGNSMVELI